MSMFELYLLTTLPGIGEFFIVASVIITLIYLFVSIFLMLECEFMETNLWYRLGVPIIAFIMMFFAALIPSHEQLAFIVGAEWATNNEDLREVPDNAAKVINGYLEELGSEIGEGE